MARSALAVAAMMLASMLTLAPPASTEAEAAEASCAAGRFCTWSRTGYTGDPRQITRGGSNCVSFAVVPYRRSFINNSSIEGYFQSGNNCTGRERAVIGGIRDNDIGFAAGSFRFDCVSCRSD